MKKFAFIIISWGFILVACQPAGKSTENHKNDTIWSITMADMVVDCHPQLVLYNRKPGKEKLQYDVAMLAMAIDKLGSIDEKYSLYFKEYIDYFIDSTGSILTYKIDDYNLDHINFARNLITLYKRTGDQKYLDAIQVFVSQIESQPKTYSGGFWHKQIYPWQMWLDGAYMALPFIAQYAKEFNRPEWYDLAAFQLIQLYQNTIDTTTGLLYHAWDESRSQDWCDPQTGRSKHFWGRATGWYAMALTDVLDFLPEYHPQRETILNILKNLANTLMKYYDPASGGWYQVLDMGGKEGNYTEASATAMFIYVFAKGANLNYLPKEYLNIADEAFNALTQQFIVREPEGALVLTRICGGCGLGGNPYRDGSYQYYITEKQVDNDPKGVGAFILAAIELKR